MRRRTEPRLARPGSRRAVSRQERSRGAPWLLASLVLVGASACVRGGTDAQGPLLEQVQAEDLYRKGQGAARVGDYLRAEQYFAAALDRGYPDRDVVPALLRVCVAADRISAALRYAEPYLDAHPDDWALRMVVATLYQAVGDEDAALSALEQVVLEAPQRPEPRY
ncbi:MAG: tetratricopeptide repeat protein, partial [Myxococcota bacterium]